MERLGDRTSRWYVLILGSFFLLAVPCRIPGGAYSCIADFKALLYLILTGAMFVSNLPRLPLRQLVRHPFAVLALIYLLCSLLSALCSPWRHTSFFGGSRREGFPVLCAYVLSFLILRVRNVNMSALLPVFSVSVTICAVLACFQFAGWNLLGLYPEGMNWQDRNILYGGAYLGTVGNAGQTCALFAVAAALIYARILFAGGRSWFGLPVLLFCALVLGLADMFAPMLALAAVILLLLFFCEPTPGALLRWLTLSLLTASALLCRLIPVRFCPLLPLTALAAVVAGRFLSFGRLPRLIPPLSALLLFLASALFLRCYRGWYTPLRELSALLQGRLTEDFGSGRVYIWKQVLSAVPERLWLGSGPDTLLLRELPPYVWTAAETGRTIVSAIDAAHSEPMQTLVCQGLPAALCHLALLLGSAVPFVRERGNAAGICAAGALCYAFQALVGISGAASAPVFWVLLAFSCNLSFKGVPFHGSNK